MSGPLRKAVQRGAIKAQGKVSPPSSATIREVDERSGRLPSTTLRVGRYIKGRGVK